MEAKITKDFELFNGVMTGEYQEDIQEFASIFGSNFRINWKRDITLKITAKHNEAGMNLLIKFQSKHVQEENPNQLKLFNPEPDLEDDSETPKEENKGKVRQIPQSNVKELTETT